MTGESLICLSYNLRFYRAESGNLALLDACYTDALRNHNDSTLPALALFDNILISIEQLWPGTILSWERIGRSLRVGVRSGRILLTCDDGDLLAIPMFWRDPDEKLGQLLDPEWLVRRFACRKGGLVLEKLERAWLVTRPSLAVISYDSRANSVLAFLFRAGYKSTFDTHPDSKMDAFTLYEKILPYIIRRTGAIPAWQQIEASLCRKNAHSKCIFLSAGDNEQLPPRFWRSGEEAKKRHSHPISLCGLPLHEKILEQIDHPW